MSILDYAQNAADDFFTYFNISNDIERITALVIAGIYLLIIILRIVLALGYQSKYAMFTINAKPVSSKDDIPKIGGLFLRRAMTEYSMLGERGVGNINAVEIVEKNILKFNVAGWNYKSIEAFVEAFEQGILFIGAIAVFLLDSKLFFGIVALAIFAMTRLFASIFDYEVSKEKLIAETSFYMYKELGKLYVTDTSNAITKLKLEIKTIMSNQSKMIDETVRRLSSELTGAVSVSMENMTKGADETLSRLASQALIVTDPMAKWAQTLDKANIAQEVMNNSLMNINTAMGGLANVSELLNGFSERVAANGKHLEEQMTRLVSAITDLREANAASDIRAESASADLALVKTNQAALERAVSQYEVSLKTLTSQMGDAFGKIVDFHVQETYTSLNESVKDNIKTILKSNNELVERLEALFVQMRAQSKSETEMIMRIKEQIDTRFDKLQNGSYII